MHLCLRRWLFNRTGTSFGVPMAVAAVTAWLCRLSCPLVGCAHLLSVGGAVAFLRRRAGYSLCCFEHDYAWTGRSDCCFLLAGTVLARHRLQIQGLDAGSALSVLLDCRAPQMVLQLGEAAQCANFESAAVHGMC